MVDNYYTLCKKYPDTVIIIKQGSFFCCFNDNAFIVSKITGYKLTKDKNEKVRCGFSTTSEEKVAVLLSEKQINYKFFDKGDICKEDSFESNNYINFRDSLEMDVQKVEYRKSVRDEVNVKNKDYADNISNKDVGINIPQIISESKSNSENATLNRAQKSTIIVANGLSYNDALVSLKVQIDAFLSTRKRIDAIAINESSDINNTNVLLTALIVFEVI